MISNATYSYNQQTYPLAIDWNNSGTAINNICKGRDVTVTMNLANAETTTWTGPNYSFPATWYVSSYSITNPILKLQLYTVPSTGQWQLMATNTCGSAAFPLLFRSQQCTDPVNCNNFAVSPNPTSDGRITIMQKPAPIDCPPADKSGIDKVNIYDDKGFLTRSIPYKNSPTKIEILLTKGTTLQIIEVVSGTYKEQHKIFVQQQ
jgi:hypothetical protein